MVALKHSDYGCAEDLPELLKSGSARATELVASGEFARQMQRFIPSTSLETTIGRPGYVEALAARITDAYADVTRRLRP